MGETISIRITNGAFFFFWDHLEDLCDEIGIEPTRRQAAKFKQGRGLLWQAYQKRCDKKKGNGFAPKAISEGR